jgi:CDP-diacylglycerol--serine O-phosphatidyltransferase
MKQLPNLITLGNLFLGCLAILAVLSGQYAMAVYCLLGSFACDYADGMVARALGVSSPLGKELDSLADVVSFGVVPGMFLYTVLSRHFCGHEGLPVDADIFSACGKSLLAFTLSACAALRLGKFNLDTRQTTYFLGLSTPATTILVVGVCMAILNKEPFGPALDQPVVLLPLIAVLCYLMLSEVKLLGLKINPKQLSANIGTFVALVFAAALIYFFSYSGAALAIVFYIIGSVVWFKTQPS